MMDDEQKARMAANMARAQHRAWASLTAEQKRERGQRIADGMHNKWQPPEGYEQLYAELREKRISMREAQRMIEEHIIVVARRLQRAAEQQNGDAHAVGSEERHRTSEESEDAGAEKEMGQDSKQRPEVGQE